MVARVPAGIKITGNTVVIRGGSLADVSLMQVLYGIGIIRHHALSV